MKHKDDAKRFHVMERIDASTGAVGGYAFLTEEEFVKWNNAKKRGSTAAHVLPSRLQ